MRGAAAQGVSQTPAWHTCAGGRKRPMGDAGAGVGACLASRTDTSLFCVCGSMCYKAGGCVIGHHSMEVFGTLMV
jgi:hypothetical protein